MKEFNREDLLEDPIVGNLQKTSGDANATVAVTFQMPVSSEMAQLAVNEQFIYENKVYQVLRKDQQYSRDEYHSVIICI